MVTDPWTLYTKIKIAIETAKEFYDIYTSLKTKQYGDVHTLLTARITFNEAVRFDEWRTRIQSVISRKGARKEASGELVVGDSLKIIRITEEIISFPQIDLLEEELTSLSDEEDESEQIYYVKSGVIEATPLCSEKTCLVKAVEVLVDIVSEFEGQFSKARIFIELFFSSLDKATKFYSAITKILNEKHKNLISERKVIVYAPTPVGAVQIVIAPYYTSIVNDIEEELFRRKLLPFGG